MINSTVAVLDDSGNVLLCSALSNDVSFDDNIDVSLTATATNGTALSGTGGGYPLPFSYLSLSLSLLLNHLKNSKISKTESPCPPKLVCIQPHLHDFFELIDPHGL